MRDRLLVAGFLGFLGGVLTRSLFYIPWPAFGVVLLLIAISTGAWIWYRRCLYLLLILFFVGVVLGVLRTEIVSQKVPEDLVPLFGSEQTFEGTIVADPDIRETSQRVTVELESGSRVLAVGPLYPEVRYGERIGISGVLEKPEPFDTNGGRVFRYDRYLAKDGIFVLAKNAHLEVLEERHGLAHVMGALLDMKRAFLSGLSVALPEPEASLAGGLVAGGKQGLGDRLLNVFIVAGLVHIVVLSGYNVMIVAEAVLKALRFLPKRVATSIAGFVIAAFVLAAGAGAASIRAGIMAGLALLARATGRTYDVIRALAASALFMLLLNPLLLAYDPGFQLSFVATLGLILGAPVIEARLSFIKGPFWRDLLASTIAAQVSVLPLLLYQNGLLSLVSLPANLLALPVVPLAMFLSAIAGILGLIIPAIAPVLSLAAYGVLAYIVWVAEILAALPLSSLALPAFPFPVVVVVYSGLAWILCKRSLREVAIPTVRKEEIKS